MEIKILVLKEDTGCDGSTTVIVDDPENPVDVREYWKEERGETDEEIQELIDSGYLNWDCQQITLPDSIIRAIKSEGLREKALADVIKLRGGHLPRSLVEVRREIYPKGARLQLTHMNDPYSPVPDGTCGTVDFVDDAGLIHMKWDNGRTLALVPDVDTFISLND